MIAAAQTIDSPPATSTALEMIDVTVTSLKDSARVMVEGVNWTVATGDFWVIGGLHASGKSDFLALAAGIVRPARGTYRVFGRQLIGGYENELLATRLRLGLVFDGGQLLNHLTIAENIALPICYHGDCAPADAAARVDELLELTGLTPWAGETPNTISRNWQQRAGLARALALKPEVLFLDNPLTGLDPRDAAWWLDLLAQLSAGHPVVNGRAMTLVASGDDFRPWQGRARQFAMLKHKQFLNLGNRPEAAREAALLQEQPGSKGA
jgi:ABC-type transporter Mla maintaining outer membrane lipid asymmetry ATPase subunit MlaF